MKEAADRKEKVTVAKKLVIDGEPLLVQKRRQVVAVKECSDRPLRVEGLAQADHKIAGRPEVAQDEIRYRQRLQGASIGDELKGAGEQRSLQ